jgi:prepilin-type N-terminal cleavage/methylation domain-containing protein
MTKARGFTLLELLVVLAMVAALAGLIGPALFNQVARAEERSQRDQVVDAIAGWSFRSFRLAEAVRYEVGDTLTASDARVTIPEGWQVHWRTAIWINLLGVCSGGEFVVRSSAGGEWAYRLKAPHCDQPELLDAP